MYFRHRSCKFLLRIYPMDWYYKKLDNFISKFTNNLYFEYDKNKMLKQEIQKYKSIYRKLPFQGALDILNGADNLILNTIDTVYSKINLLGSKNFKIIKERSSGIDLNNSYPESYNDTPSYPSRSLIAYDNSLTNTVRHFLSLMNEKFTGKNSKIKMFIKQEVLPNVFNVNYYTKEGEDDIKMFCERFRPLSVINMRNIENKYESPSDKLYIFSFDATVVGDQAVYNFSFEARIVKDIDERFKIESLEYKKLG